MSFFVNTMVCGFSLYQILAFFLIYSCLGWCLEVIYAAVSTGQLVNRGFLNGPVCPIYGFGMIIVLFTLSPLVDNLLLLYIGGVAGIQDAHEDEAHHLGDHLHKARDHGVNGLHHHNGAHAPQKGELQADISADVEGEVAVIPPPGV